MTVLRGTLANANLTVNATNHIQEAMMLYVLLMLPALARNQSIGYIPPYYPTAPAAPTGYPTYGNYGAYGYPAFGAAPGLPPVYAPTTQPFPGSFGSFGSFGNSQSQGLGFPSGWPARPLGPLAAALATAYPSLFSALSLAGPCRSWCRAPSLPLLFPPRIRTCDHDTAAGFIAASSEESPVLRAIRAMGALRSLIRDQDQDHDDTDGVRGPLMRLIFPQG